MAYRQDVEELQEILAVLRQEVIPLLHGIAEVLPSLIRRVHEVLYSEESAMKLGRSIGNYYQSLKESGLPEETCRELALRYAEGATFDWLVKLLTQALKRKEQGERETEREG